MALLPDNLKRTRPATAFFSVEQAAADLAAKEEAAAKKPRKEVKGGTGGKVGKSNKTNKQGNKEDKAAAASTPPPATEKSPASQPAGHRGLRVGFGPVRVGGGGGGPVQLLRQRQRQQQRQRLNQRRGS